MTQRFLPALLGTAALLAAGAAASSAHAIGFVVTNLVSDGSVPAANTDARLKNPWGVSYLPTGPFWISDNATGLTTLYTGSGANFAPLPQVIIPPNPGSAPTGQVVNSGIAAGAFQIGGATPLFLFDSEDGRITGWAPSMGGTAQTGFISSTGAVFKGLAAAASGGNSLLYAADFHNGVVDLFTNDFSTVSTTATDPGLASGYAPFNTQVLNGKLYVTFAKQDATGDDDVAGAGNGYVDVFNLDGTFDHRIASQGDPNLNSPWGLAIAPSNWGPYAGKLLVGNFGDGTISVYDQNTNAFLGKINDTSGNPLVYGDLWALIPGNGALAGDTSKIYFTAGLVEESEGLFASIGVPEPNAWALMILGAGLAGAALRRRHASLSRG